MNELEGRCDDIDTLPLFDIEPVEVVKPEPMSAGRRRTVRQREAVERGQHPLALSIGGVYRHPGTKGQDYSAVDPKGRDLTCGSCVHRESLRGGANDYPKCTVGGGRRVTGGPGSDVRAWWPGCSEWAPK